ncbi:MAG: PQQ-binding-like beta-propeller repeat protein [Myxococcaceae bacterium]
MFPLFFIGLLALKTAPSPVIIKNYCISSLFSEPETGCISWNRYESAGPLVDQDQVYVGGSDGKLHVLSRRSGLTQKRIVLPGKLKAQPTLVGTTLLLGTDQGYLVSLNTQTWEQNWQTKLDAELPNPILVSAQQVYASSGLATLYALDLNTGDILWEQKRGMSAGLGLKTQSNPLILSDKLVIGNPSGKLDFIRLSDGALLFDVALGDMKKSFPNVATDPILIGSDKIAAAGFNQGLAVLDANTGVILWSVPNLPSITRLITDNQLLIAAGPKELTAIDLNTQKTVWRFLYTKGSPNRLLAKNGLLYFGSDQDALYVLNLKTGRPLQILGSGLGFAADFDFSSDHTLFALSTAGYLYQYGRKTNSSCCGFN